ncbi:Solute carrier 49 member 4 [Branchiostoma belcheri]|nr:Solute carrier 49 member 4 [Branchiostoma belcheri]
MRVWSFRPTTGGIMTMTALHACDKLSLYGMGYNIKYSNHYFDTEYHEFLSVMNSHNHIREIQLWDHLDKEGIKLIYTVDGILSAMDTRSRDRRTSSATEYDPLLNRIRTDSYASGVTTNSYSVNAKTSHGPWRVYKRRWYILVLFSLVCFDQSVVLNTWSPISDSAKLVFGWKDGDISLLSNWGSITFVGLALVGPWVIQSLARTANRALSRTMFRHGYPESFWIVHGYPKPLIHTGQFLDGLAGIITMAAPPVVSSVWFPPEQRTLATGINVFISYMGYAVAFVIGPLVVTQTD